MSILYEAISSFIDLKVNRECLVSWIDKDALVILIFQKAN